MGEGGMFSSPMIKHQFFSELMSLDWELLQVILPAWVGQGV